MDTFVSELQKLVSFKDTTGAGDIVLIASRDPQMVVYALVTKIEPDRSRKESWWNVTMQILAVPPREVVWTLREPQFTGREIFSFGGIEHFMKAIRFQSASGSSPPPAAESKKKSGPSAARLRVIK
ncbi:MAG TPA: hypothetical protein ENO11_03735 [Desulfobacteraceae bacterium]|nr:hypothetical protein [Desulfobacteraceae bacterium]